MNTGFGRDQIAPKCRNRRSRLGWMAHGPTPAGRCARAGCRMKPTAAKVDLARKAAAPPSRPLSQDVALQWGPTASRMLQMSWTGAAAISWRNSASPCFEPMQVSACPPLVKLARPAPAWPRLAACWLLCLLALTAGAMGATTHPALAGPTGQVQDQVQAPTQRPMPVAAVTSMVAMTVSAEAVMAKSVGLERPPVHASALRRWGLRALALGVGAGMGWAFLRLGANTAKRKKTAHDEVPRKVHRS